MNRSEQIQTTKAFLREHSDVIVRRYEAGETLSQIAADTPVSAPTISALLKARGVQARGRNSGRLWQHVTPDLAEAMRAAYEGPDGVRLQDLADRHGISISTVSLAIRRVGGTIRKRGYGSIPPPTGPNNHAWRGGRHQRSGYWMIRVQPSDPFFSMAHRGYIPEHRFVMAAMVKRPLSSDETVHHIDGNGLNNDPDNLQLRLGHHGRGAHWRCVDCGSQNIAPAEI